MKRLICVLVVFLLLLSLSACHITVQLPEWFGGKQAEENTVVDMPESDFIIQGDSSDKDTVIHVITPDIEVEVPSDIEEDVPADTPATVGIIQPEFLGGEWISASRSGDTIYTDWYYFDKDGTISTSGGEYVHTSQYPDLFAGYEEGWQPMPMGSTLTFGTYELDGNILTISYTGEEYFGNFDSPIVHVFEILSLTEDKLVIVNVDGSLDPQIYIRNNYLPIEEICDAVGVDTSID